MWISGPTGFGKSHFLMELIKRGIRTYVMPLDEDFYDDYYDEEFDLIVLEEYRSQKTIQFLNRIADGLPQTLRKKGSQYLKKKKLPILVLSNYIPSTSYHKSARDIVATIERRFEVINLIERLDMFPEVVEENKKDTSSDSELSVD